jgi:hypothetical protein
MRVRERGRQGGPSPVGGLGAGPPQNKSGITLYRDSLHYVLWLSGLGVLSVVA